ncbi:hypothetical protein [Proteiniclasticum sp. QWL-01]|uniref:hypothetical protein n=1 Tax=Proteiniclasticum sp. QWL-01 TaxID=3036945 RepID=UPI00240F0444|nr:hypothetical protein [Proteiniclasticum sp. QWL-01]WFF71958.1 hypothetical protein P6M73_11675 [Proteiniclasticum sp. QWL-01]
MKKHVPYSLIIMVLLVTMLLPTASLAAQSDDQIKVEVCLMDDYGNVLKDYTTKYFQISNGRFVYRKAPLVSGYVFATANVLKLETEKGHTYRVQYFYTLESQEPAPLPEPVPMAEMPLKRTPLEERIVWVSWTDSTMKELRDSKTQSWDFFWEAYDIPAPAKLAGYGFQQLLTGEKTYKGRKVPHFVFVYEKAEASEPAPSLIFDHLIESRTIRTLQAEPNPPEPNSSGAATRPMTQPATRADTRTDASAEAPGTRPESEAPTGTTTTRSDAATSDRETSSTSDGTTRPGDKTGNGTSAPAQSPGRAAIPLLVGGIILSLGTILYRFLKR